MKHLQGKVISIPIIWEDLKEGMQVIGTTGSILKISAITHKENQSGLKTLVVEYEEYENGDSYFGRLLESKEYPLKYSQWQSVIDNGEVDSDKVIEFEILEDGKYAPGIAKIIPQKKRMYSEEEIVLKIYNYHNWLSSNDRSKWATTDEWINHHIGKGIQIKLK